MERLSRDAMLMMMALTVARRGTCDRLQVGAIFSREGRALSMGYNGTPSGMPHCEHLVWEPRVGNPMPEKMREAMERIEAEQQEMSGSKEPVFTDFSADRLWTWDGEMLMIHASLGADTSCRRAAHAERNGIAFAARYGVALDGSELHVTHAPCESCAGSIINAGITRVVYNTPYRIVRGLELLGAAGIEVVAYENLE